MKKKSAMKKLEAVIRETWGLLDAARDRRLTRRQRERIEQMYRIVEHAGK